MFPVVNFVYPMFTNDDLLADAGVSAPPTNRSEFSAAASAVNGLADDIAGWILPLSLESPNGIQNDVMSWTWASGGSTSTIPPPSPSSSPDGWRGMRLEA